MFTAGWPRHVHSAVQPAPPSSSGARLILQNWNSVPSKQLLIPAALSPGNYHSVFCLSEFSYSGTSHEWNPTVFVFIYLLSLFISLSISSSRFIHIIACARMSFLFKAEYYPVECIFSPHFISTSGADTWDASVFWLL